MTAVTAALLHYALNLALLSVVGLAFILVMVLLYVVALGVFAVLGAAIAWLAE